MAISLPGVLVWLLAISELASQAATSADNVEAASSATTDPPLPMIWGHLGSDQSALGSFRILSELRLADGEGTFLLEEWADGPRKLYRVDSVAVDLLNRQTAGRQTILVNGDRKERFFFEPFKCRLLEGQSFREEQLPAHLKLMPPQEPFQISGLAAIWLYAMQTKRAKFRAAQDLSDDNNKNSKDQKGRRLTIKRVLAAYDKFTVEPDDNFDQLIELYFRTNGLRESDNSIDPNSLSAIHLVEQKTGKIVLSAKIIEIETLLQATLKMDEQLFELPLGYGCVRPSGREPKQPTIYHSPGICFGAIQSESRDVAQVCNLQVVSMLPAKPNDDVDKWKTHSSSLRFIAGRPVPGHPFVVQERRDFAPASAKSVNASSPPSSSSSSSIVGGPIVRRMRRVWQLDTKDAAPLEVSMSREEPSLVFELTDHMQTCVSTKSASISQLPAIEVPLLVPKSAIGTGRLDNDELKNSPTEGKTHVWLTSGLALDAGMMHELFVSTSGFSTIRTNTNKWIINRNLVQEKRVDSFELHDSSSGKSVWRGPVSIVRKVFLLDSLEEEEEADKLTTNKYAAGAPVALAQADIYLLSATSDAILGRVQLRLPPSQPSTSAYLHRELDIGPCLKQTGGRVSSLNFVVSYPFDFDEDTSEAIAQMDEQIYEQFLTKLIALSGDTLDPLQVSTLEVDVEFDQVIISGTLHEWPELFDFKQLAGMRLGASSTHFALLASELKPTESECAASCAHLACASFVYCASTHTCNLIADLKQVDKRAPAASVAFEPDANCNLWERRSSSTDPIERAIPAQLFNLMRQDVLTSSVDYDQDEDAANGGAQTLSALTIELDLASLLGDTTNEKTKVSLMPSAVDTSDGRMSDDAALLLNDSGHVAQLNTATTSTDSARAEYEILFAGRKLVRAKGDEATFPLDEATHMNYQDCEQLCRENNCQSFSHCEVEQTCLISQLAQKSQLEEVSQKNGFCRVLARVQLSRFHRFNRIAPPPPAQPQQKQESQPSSEPNSVLSRLWTGSSRDCALKCLEESAEHACKSFFYCPQEKLDCILMADRQSQVEGSKRVRDTNETSEASCDLYRRSYLVDYNRLQARRLSSEQVAERLPGNSLELHLGLDAESCASECAHSDDDCLAFHVCAYSDFTTGHHQIQCALLSKVRASPSTFALLQLDLINGELLERSKTCTTFVGKLQVVDLPDNERSQDATSSLESSGSSWVSGLLFVTLGLVLGYALTSFLAMQNNRISKILIGLRQQQTRNF